MIHSYSGSYEQAAQLVDMGFYLSFGGAITHDRAVKLRETAGMLPLTSLLIETDAPDQPDALHYGQRNEPAFISNVLATLAKLHNEDIDVLSSQLYNNTRNLFRLNI
jgi:TatD DNase family protein